MDTAHFVLIESEDGEGTTTAAVAPSWGGSVIALCYQRRDWAWPLPVLEAADLASIWRSPTSYGMPLLAPTPGRVGRNQSGRFEYAGRGYDIRPTRHGLVRQLPWEVCSRSPTGVTCQVQVELPSRSGLSLFPFQFRAEHSITVGPRRLDSRVRLVNTGDLVQPLNVGWHPYLHRSGPCTVRIPARGYWVLDDEPQPTPTGEIAPVLSERSFKDGRVLDEAEHWDDVLTDLDFEDGAALCWVEEDARMLTKRQELTPLRVRRIVAIPQITRGQAQRVANVQLYTPKGRGAIAIEPLSAPPNALNLLARGHRGIGVREVSPGESVDFEITVALEARDV